MKSKIYIALVSILLIVSCDDFLDQDPITEPLTEVVFTNQEVVQRLIPGAYQPMRWEFVPTFGDSYAMTYIYSDVRSDDVIIENTFFQPQSHEFELPSTLTTTNVNVALIWSKFFTGIARANQIIGGLSTVDESVIPDKQLFIAESRFLRAFYYFEAVKNFGEVPLFTETTDVGVIDNIKRKPISEVYAQINADFRAAIELLPESWEMPTGTQEPNEAYRATKGAAQGLLAKAYMYQENWDSAAYFAQEVINSGVYALEENYADNWVLSNEHGVESLFEIAFFNDPSGGSWNAGAQGSLTAQFFFPPFDAPATGWSYNLTTPELQQAFVDENDLVRLDATILTAGHEFGSQILADQGNDPVTQEFIDNSPAIVGGQYGTGYSYSLKYFITPEQIQNETTDFVLSPLNHKVLRYSEILLILAEATLNGAAGDGQGAFDQVRDRVGLPSKPLTMEALKLERRLELATEWNRYYDLLRWGDAASEIEDFVPGREYLPIPQDEIELVGPDTDGSDILTQNIGY